MENRQKISVFRVAFKKKQVEPNPIYLQISKVNLATMQCPNTPSEGKRTRVKSKELLRKSSIEIENTEPMSKIVPESERNKRGKVQSRIKSLSSDHRTRLQLKTAATNLLQIRQKQTLDSPIHSRKCQRFRILAGTFRKHRSHTCQTTQNSSTQGIHGDMMQIRKETIHDFNDYSIKYIQNLQRQAARVSKTAERQVERNRINYKSSQAKRKIRLEDGLSREKKGDVFRPWSREKYLEFGEEEGTTLTLI